MSSKGDASENAPANLLDEESMERQVPLREPAARGRSAPLGGGAGQSDDETADDSEYEEEEESSWSSCSSDEWTKPQDHDTLRIRGTRNVHAILEESEAPDMVFWAHQVDNDVRTATLDDASSDDHSDEQESYCVHLTLPLPFTQINPQMYLEHIVQDNPRVQQLRGDTLVGDDVALRCGRQLERRFLEVVDRPYTSGVVHAMRDGRSGIPLGGVVDVQVMPLCFVNGGHPPSEAPAVVGFSGQATEGLPDGAASYDRSGPKNAKGRKLEAQGNRDRRPRASPTTTRTAVAARRVASALKAELSDAAATHASKGPQAPFSNWVKRMDDYIGQTIKPFWVNGEQFFISNPFRSGTIVSYDGPHCRDSAVSPNDDVTSQQLEDESNFGTVRTCAVHVLLQLFVSKSATAFAADSPLPAQLPPKNAPKEGESLDLSGCDLREPTKGVIVIALDADDVVDINFEILGSDRHLVGENGNDRNTENPARRKPKPSYHDPISPGTVVENLSAEFIEERATFVIGSIDDILLHSSGKRGGGKDKKKRRPSRNEGVRITGVVVMAYPSRVEVANEVTQMSREFAPWELLVLESSRSDNCLPGRVGFVVDVEGAFCGHRLHSGGVELSVETAIGRGKGLKPKPLMERRKESSEANAATVSSESADESGTAISDSEEAEHANPSSAGRQPRIRERRLVKETAMSTVKNIEAERKQVHAFAMMKEREDAERELHITEHCSTKLWQPRVSSNYIILACRRGAEAARKFYANLGICFTFDDDAYYRKLENIRTSKAKDLKVAFWLRKIEQLMPFVNKLVTINSTRSKVDMVLRDGTMLYDIPSFHLLESRRNEDSDHDFYPMDLVLPTMWKRTTLPISWKELPMSEANGDEERPSHFAAMTDELKHTTSANDEASVLGFEEPSCSVYDCSLLYDYETELRATEVVYVRRRNDRFFEMDLETINGDPGVGTSYYDKQQPSVVGIILACDSLNQTCDVRWVRQRPDLDCARARFGNMSGEILELLPNTKVRVMWQDGTIADMWRGELSVVQDFESETDMGDEEVEEFEDFTDEEAPSEVDQASPADAASASDRTGESQPPTGILHAAGNLVSRLASRLVQGGSSATQVSTPAASGSDTEEEVVDSLGEFKVCTTFSAHHFREHAAPEELGATTPARTRRIQREWKNLRDSLPPGITVKVSEDDLNLMKFAIVGPVHTPYYQSLLCFDLFFPAQFPLLPPRVHFHSYNLRLNPNLYENGHICLSLLGTWQGEKATEGWMPATSTVLQVLVSIQSLVLVKEPFYNEAGFEERKGSASGRDLSKNYSESVQHKRLQHMILAARNPVPDWIYEHRQHFRVHAPKLITRLRRSLRSQQPSQSGSITADGLILPVTLGAARTMENILNALETTHQDLTTRWESEMEEDETRFEE